MLNIGDYVSRKKYNHDIVFKVEKIIGSNVILKGVDIRLYADAEISDLVQRTKSKSETKDNFEYNLKKIDGFVIPGRIMHFDSDKDYLKKCLSYYKKNNLRCYGYILKEEEYEKNIIKELNKYKPEILVITGHDAYYKKNDTYKNSKYFINTIKKIKKEYNYSDKLVIIAGACQSDFVNLIKEGACFASSPSHINISALDPAIIATNIALSNNTETINLKDLLEKTEYGPNGIGGIQIFGVMIYGYPRKE